VQNQEIGCPIFGKPARTWAKKKRTSWKSGRTVTRVWPLFVGGGAISLSPSILPHTAIHWGAELARFLFIKTQIQATGSASSDFGRCSCSTLYWPLYCSAVHPMCLIFHFPKEYVIGLHRNLQTYVNPLLVSLKSGRPMIVGGVKFYRWTHRKCTMNCAMMTSITPSTFP